MQASDVPASGQPPTEAPPPPRPVARPRRHRHRGRRPQQAAWRQQQAAAEEPVEVELEQSAGRTLGATLAKVGGKQGAVIFDVLEGGLLDAWNKAHPDRAVVRGSSVTRVNEATCFWSILDEASRAGRMKMVVSRPTPGGALWCDGAASLSEGLRQSQNSVLVLLPRAAAPHHPALCSLPAVAAGSVGADYCSVCACDVGEREAVVRLPCRHAFHRNCIARWLSQPFEGSARQQMCPLCRRLLVCNPDGSTGLIEH